VTTLLEQPVRTPVQAPPTLEAHGIVKRFGPLVAVDHADLVVQPGVHALLGENGAGKSTLVKVLYGFHRPDAGEIRVGGRVVDVRTPADARELGIGLVFQQFTLIPALTVAENAALFVPELGRVVDNAAIARRICEMSERYGLAVDPKPRAGALSLPEQQRVEIVRVLLAGAHILCFDEPTSALPPQEVDGLLDVFRRLRDDGYAIVFITHKLPEVFALADTVTVMRKGAVVGTHPLADVDETALIEEMFGEAPARAPHVRRGASGGPSVCTLEDVSSVGQGRPLSHLDLTIHAGEIVGVAGVSGNGQREVADTIAGVARIVGGRRTIGGFDATRWSIDRIREAGVGYVPERALDEELLWNLTLRENVVLGSRRRLSRRGGFAIDWAAVDSEWADRIGRFGLDLPDPETRAGTLSGGNAQRLAVARELAREPRLLVALYPTRGLDVRSAAAVQDLLLQARDGGAGVLLVSQDLNELTSLSDRLLVMRSGAFVGEVDPAATNAYELGRLMTGAGE
jgi:general nucleoside transport system ATP-binding protein